MSSINPNTGAEAARKRCKTIRPAGRHEALVLGTPRKLNVSF